MTIFKIDNFIDNNIVCVWGALANIMHIALQPSQNKPQRLTCVVLPCRTTNTSSGMLSSNPILEFHISLKTNEQKFKYEFSLDNLFNTLHFDI